MTLGIFYNLFSQSKDKAYEHCLRKFVKTSPPPLLLTSNVLHTAILPPL